MTKPSTVALKITRNISLFLVFFLLSLLILIWTASPYAVRYAANTFLEEHKLQVTKNASVRLNPFLAKLSISNFEIIDQNNKSYFKLDAAVIRVKLSRLVNKQIFISQFEVKDGFIDARINDTQRIIAGINLADLEKSESTSSSEIQSPQPSSDYKLIVPEISLENFNATVNYNEQLQSITVNSIQLSDIEADSFYQQANIFIDGNWDATSFSLSSQIDLENLNGNIQTEVTLSQLDFSQLNDFIQEPIPLKGFGDIDGNATIQLNKNEIDIVANKLAIKTQDLDITHAPWLYSAATQTLTITEAKLDLLENKLSLASGFVSLKINDAQLALDHKRNRLSQWDTLELAKSQFKYDGTLFFSTPQLSIDKLVGLAALPAEDADTSQTHPPIAEFEKLTINEITLTSDSALVDSVEIFGLNASAVLDKEKKIQSLPDFSILESKENDTKQAEFKEESEPTPASFSIKLNKFTFGSPGQILVQDDSVAPPYKRTFTIDILDAGPFDSQKVENISPFNVEGKSNTYATFSIKGDTKPFTEKLNINLDMQLKEVSLPSLSSYLKNTLGFELQSGQLNNDLKIEINNDKLSGRSKLFVAGLKMSAAENYEQNTIKEGTAMPLNTALNLLKDGDGNLKLKIPISGDISDPSFGLSSFTALVIRKAAMRQTKSYLINTFVPYASVVTVALTGAEYLLKVRFEPLNYDAMQVEIQESQKKYIDQLVNLLRDKKKLKVKTCSISTLNDIATSDKNITNEQVQQLIDIGQKRQERLKAYLVEQQIDSSRILFCAPKIDKKDNAAAKILLKSIS